MSNCFYILGGCKNKINNMTPVPIRYYCNFLSTLFRSGSDLLPCCFSPPTLTQSDSASVPLLRFPFYPDPIRIGLCCLAVISLLPRPNQIRPLLPCCYSPPTLTQSGSASVALLFPVFTSYPDPIRIGLFCLAVISLLP